MFDDLADGDASRSKRWLHNKRRWEKLRGKHGGVVPSKQTRAGNTEFIGSLKCHDDFERRQQRRAAGIPRAPRTTAFKHRKGTGRELLHGTARKRAAPGTKKRPAPSGPPADGELLHGTARKRAATKKRPAPSGPPADGEDILEPAEPKPKKRRIRKRDYVGITSGERTAAREREQSPVDALAKRQSEDLIVPPDGDHCSDDDDVEDGSSLLEAASVLSASDHDGSDLLLQDSQEEGDSSSPKKEPSKNLPNLPTRTTKMVGASRKDERKTRKAWVREILGPEERERRAAKILGTGGFLMEGSLLDRLTKSAAAGVTSLSHKDRRLMKSGMLSWEPHRRERVVEEEKNQLRLIPASRYYATYDLIKDGRMRPAGPGSHDEPDPAAWNCFLAVDRGLELCGWARTFDRRDFGLKLAGKLAAGNKPALLKTFAATYTTDLLIGGQKNGDVLVGKRLNCSDQELPVHLPGLEEVLEALEGEGPLDEEGGLDDEEGPSSENDFRSIADLARRSRRTLTRALRFALSVDRRPHASTGASRGHQDETATRIQHDPLAEDPALLLSDAVMAAFCARFLPSGCKDEIITQLFAAVSRPGFWVQQTQEVELSDDECENAEATALPDDAANRAGVPKFSSLPITSDLVDYLEELTESTPDAETVFSSLGRSLLEALDSALDSEVLLRVVRRRANGSKRLVYSAKREIRETVTKWRGEMRVLQQAGKTGELAVAAGELVRGHTHNISGSGKSTSSSFVGTEVCLTEGVLTVGGLVRAMGAERERVAGIERDLEEAWTARVAKKRREEREAQQAAEEWGDFAEVEWGVGVDEESRRAPVGRRSWENANYEEEDEGAPAGRRSWENANYEEGSSSWGENLFSHRNGSSLSSGEVGAVAPAMGGKKGGSAAGKKGNKGKTGTDGAEKGTTSKGGKAKDSGGRKGKGKGGKGGKMNKDDGRKKTRALADLGEEELKNIKWEISDNEGEDDDFFC